jgi:hypothetical protein
MKTKSRSQIEEEQYVYRQFFYYLLSKDTSNIDKKYESVLYDLIFNDLYSLQGVFDIKNKKVKAYENIVRIKINRINNFINCLEELGSFELLDKVKSIVEETLKVYETSKLMYDNFNDNVEANMKTLRDKFSLTNIEFRNPEGRESAMNI